MVWLGSPHSILLCILMLCGYGMHSATDNTAYDTTIHSNLVWNHALNTYPDTFYFNIVGKVNKEVEYEEEDHREDKTDKRTTPYRVLKFLMKLFHIPAPKSIAGIITEHWLHHGTDGVVCTYAQEFPRVTNRHKSEEVRRLKGKEDVHPGVWYYSHRSISHICTSFMCEKTWSYILHIVEDLDKRYQTKCKHDKRLEQTLEVEQRKQFKAAKQKANTSHLFQQYKPDMQDCDLALKDCHDCSAATASPISYSPIVVGIRVVAMLSLSALMFKQLLTEQSCPGPVVQCCDSSCSNSIHLQESTLHKLTLMIPAVLSIVMQAGVQVFCINKTWERTAILPYLCWETCHGLIRFTVLFVGLLSTRLGSVERTIIPLLPSILRWSWLVEGLANAAFGMDKASVLQPALKLGTGIVTANLLQTWSLSANIWTLCFVILALMGQQLLMMLPSIMWIGLHETPVTDRKDRDYSIRMGYIMGALFFMMVSCIVITVSPILYEVLLSNVGSDHTGEISVKVWLLLQCIWSFIKYSDFTHYVTFVLIKVKFLFYRMEEWKAKEGTADYIPMRMLD